MGYTETIGSCCRFIVQNVDFCQLRMYHDWYKTAVAGAVKGQKIQRIGSAAEHTLPQSVCRVGFIRHFISLLGSADEGLNILNALGIGGGNHLGHFDNPMSLHLAVNIVSAGKTGSNAWEQN